MNLFHKDIDIVKRILNLILIIWFVGALIFSYNHLVDLLFDKENYTYEEYETLHCSNDMIKQSCEQSYESHKQGEKRSSFSDKKSLINALGNAVIVGTFIFILNKNKKS